ncbi:MAG: DUF2452 domain-containing protein [Gammaproteobacteria bacterium]|nr:DUF2452 domain-containing protein [Gammaproteobacteria bacterium]
MKKPPQRSPTAPYIHRGSDNTAPYPVSRMAPAVELVDLAKEIAQADELVGLQLNHKLRVIADQIKRLQDAAHDILSKAQQDQQLNHAECNFKKVAGKTYHLYAKDEDQLYWSLLSPQDWNNTPPHQYRGAWVMQADHTWLTTDSESDQSRTQAIIQGLLDSN